ncbi:LacI family DNA-binding transcriptional regulator [Dyadobacter frigoris]|uniref:LacI family transcriptional regulator n=1 Tax=Dyadobacter frigoris TaxID=2576211 RepID=A0A4U6CTL8_9BACT|nr:LacI family DNA-binding transcriptional regulator [Dyadobacter frigoris]TKT87025.1 LacI family transcriptional regulator [Dyadobacter frigoris]GLU52779.1 LacI family transcriptional regulator [Dyadobacter frigoris]
MRRRYITIKDIAKSLNISVATVSRALRDKYDVSIETRQKVLDMAVELNYKPNFNATGLVHRSTHNIGVIIPTITNYYFSTVITGIQEIAQSNGFNIILYLTNDSPEIELKIVKNLSESSLDGLLACVSSDASNYAHFQEMIDDGLPVVFFDRVASTIETSKVMQDDYNGAFAAVEHLVDCGYRKIAHITGPKELFFTENRLRGYRNALEKHNLPANQDLIIHSGFSQKDGEKDVTKLFEGKENTPDAIFAVNDRKGIGAIIALKKMHIQVGKEVGVIGFTNDPISEIIAPTLSTVAEPAYEIGKIACELLLKHIRKTNFPAEQITLSGELIIRESTSRL